MDMNIYSTVYVDPNMFRQGSKSCILKGKAWLARVKLKGKSNRPGAGLYKTAGFAITSYTHSQH